MEVPGKRHNKDRDKGSAEDFSLYCEPCDSEGKHLQAHGYCQTCDHHLCESCYKIHTKPVPMRNHKLLDRSRMPTSLRTRLTKKDVGASKCSITCPDHSDKIIEFFCSKHNKVACGVCAVLTHKACKIEYIPDISMDYKLSEEYKQFTDAFNHMEKNIEHCLTSAVSNTKQARESSQKALDDISKFRREINAYLDQKERDVKAEAQKLQKNVETQLKEIQDRCQSLKTELDKMKSDVTNLESKSSDLLVATKQALTRIPDLEKRIDSCYSSNKAHAFRFNRENSITTIIRNKLALGRIDETVQNVKQLESRLTTNPRIDFASVSISQLPDISIKDNKDTGLCCITGATLMTPSRLLVSDWNNMSVKLIDIPTNTVISHLQLSSGPWDVTCLPQDQAAVTLPCEKKIQIISTSNSRLTPVRTIKVKGECRGIDTNGNQLIVSYVDPVKLEVIDLSGKVLKTITTDKHGNKLFSEPFYVAVGKNKDLQAIYVSDCRNHTLTKLTSDGTVLYTYKDNDLDRLEGLTVTQDGHVIICIRNNKTVQLVSPTGKKVRALLNETDGIKEPFAVCYCPVESKVYVSCINSDAMRVYSLK